MEKDTFDIMIVGAGPAGFACAYTLRNEKLKVALVDKYKFPRDKVCGDALSADVVNQLYIMNPELGARFEQFATKIDSHGISFVAPSHSKLTIDFQNPRYGNAAGYISKRIDFDNFLFQHLQYQENLHCLEEESITDLIYVDSGVKVISNKSIYHTKLIIGADGAQSIVNKRLGKIKVEKNHYSAGIRQYFEGVSGFNSQNHIELHFYKQILPGYLWIFPLPNGQANVGLGMLSSSVSKKKVNLKKALKELIEEHPNLKDRFKDARPLEDMKGYGLPIGSKKRPISGERFLLIGDAASLIDPFTGEGIGNALRSGRIAADHIVEAFNRDDFSASFNKSYDKEVYRRMWKELKISRSLQMLSKYPAILNFVIKKANNNSSVRTLLTSMLTDIDLKKELVKASFYIRLIFR